MLQLIGYDLTLKVDDNMGAWYPYNPPWGGEGRVWSHYRERKFYLGALHVASIVEYKMTSGISQYLIASLTPQSKPRPKYDSYQQAFETLKRIIDGDTAPRWEQDCDLDTTG